MINLGDECPAMAPLMPYLNGAVDWSHEQHTFDAKQVVWTTTIAAVLLIASCALLFFGRTLIRTTFAISGFMAALVVSAYAVFYALSKTHPSEEVSCALLGGVPVVCGIIGAFAAIRWMKRAFVIVGLAAGGAAGYFLYMSALNRLHSGTTIGGNDVVFYVCLIGGALIGAVAMASMRELLLIVASAAIGAVGLVPALAVVAFGRIDSRFLWVLNANKDTSHRHSPFVYGQVLAALGYFLVGVLVQRAQERRNKVSGLNETLINGGSNHRYVAHGLVAP